MELLIRQAALKHAGTCGCDGLLYARHKYRSLGLAGCRRFLSEYRVGPAEFLPEAMREIAKIEQSQSRPDKTDFEGQPRNAQPDRGRDNESHERKDQTRGHLF